MPMTRDINHRSSAAGRRSRPVKRYSSISRRVAVWRTALLAVLLAIAFAVILDDSVNILGFLVWYKTKFVGYYGPKVKYVTKMLRGLGDFVPENIATEIQEAWDFSTAVIVVASIYHLIERLRTSALAKLQ